MKKNSSKWNTDGYDGNTDGRAVMDMASNSNSGLRLRNDSRVECYLNTAINTVVTNEILMGEVIREDPLKQWGMDILLLHDPNYDPNREITHTGILSALADFGSDPTLFLPTPARTGGLDFFKIGFHGWAKNWLPFRGGQPSTGGQIEHGGAKVFWIFRSYRSAFKKQK